MTLKAVVFDMDGLMLDSEIAYQYSWQRTAADFGFNLDDRIYFRLIGLGKEETEKVLWEEFGTDFPLADFRAHYPTHWRAFTEENGIPVKPGVFELLDTLDRLKLPRAVATSTAKLDAEPRLQEANLYGRFKEHIYGNEITFGKPAPDIYLEASRRLNIEPEYCLALEDSEAGTRSATSAGMRAIIVPDMKQPSDEVVALAYRVLPSLHDVIGVVEEMAKE